LLDQLAARAKTDRAGFLASRPGLIYGTPEVALEKLRVYASLGIGHVNVMFQPYGTEREQIAALGEAAADLARSTAAA